jgi:hypothetical protein
LLLRLLLLCLLLLLLLLMRSLRLRLRLLLRLLLVLLVPLSFFCMLLLFMNAVCHRILALSNCVGALNCGMR